MYLLRRKSVMATTAINNNTTDETDEMVSLEKVKDILCDIKQLKSHDIAVVLKRNGHLVITVDDISYETT